MVKLVHVAGVFSKAHYWAVRHRSIYAPDMQLLQLQQLVLTQPDAFHGVVPGAGCFVRAIQG